MADDYSPLCDGSFFLAGAGGFFVDVAAGAVDSVGFPVVVEVGACDYFGSFSEADVASAAAYVFDGFG